MPSKSSVGTSNSPIEKNSRVSEKIDASKLVHAIPEFEKVNRRACSKTWLVLKQAQA
jgi:hypothetical protein